MFLTLFPEIEEAEYRKAEEEFLKQRTRIKKNSRYYKDELRYQEAQEHWEQFGDLKSWNIMYMQIQKACFNCINKKLCRKIPNEEIESYSHDVTMNILQTLSAKKMRGEFWKIARLSAFVHLPCMVIYQMQKQFEDKVLDESAYTIFEDGSEHIKEREESFLQDGIYHI